MDPIYVASTWRAHLGCPVSLPDQDGSPCLSGSLARVTLVSIPLLRYLGLGQWWSQMYRSIRRSTLPAPWSLARSTALNTKSTAGRHFSGHRDYREYSGVPGRDTLSGNASKDSLGPGLRERASTHAAHQGRTCVPGSRIRLGSPLVHQRGRAGVE